MRILENPKSLITFLVTLTLALALIRNATAQSSSEMQTFFSKDYAGISITVNATKETIPGGNTAIGLWINCTSVGVKVDYLNLSVYGFKSGKEKILLNFTCALLNAPISLNQTIEYNYNVSIPSDVWDATYGELYLKYAIVDQPMERNAGFQMTIVRNVYLEELEQQLKSLNESYQQLNNTLEQLNQTFWGSFQINLSTENLAYLNKTYWELRQNYTELQQKYSVLEGSANELDNTRRVVAILVVTTVFFVATTLYLVLRKPKDYW